MGSMSSSAPHLLLISNLSEYLLLLLKEQRNDVLLAHLDRRRPSSFDPMYLDVCRREGTTRLIFIVRWNGNRHETRRTFPGELLAPLLQYVVWRDRAQFSSQRPKAHLHQEIDICILEKCAGLDSMYDTLGTTGERVREASDHAAM